MRNNITATPPFFKAVSLLLLRHPLEQWFMSKRESAECHAFQRCFAYLAGGITDPGRLAIHLYSKELIGPDTGLPTGLP